MSYATRRHFHDTRPSRVTSLNRTIAACLIVGMRPEPALTNNRLRRCKIRSDNFPGGVTHPLRLGSA
jgi:hypothetical protein